MGIELLPFRHLFAFLAWSLPFITGPDGTGFLPHLPEGVHPMSGTQTLTPRLGEELTFHASPRTTLGVELELQVLDRDTGDLVPGAVALPKACAAEGDAGVSAGVEP